MASRSHGWLKFGGLLALSGALAGCGRTYDNEIQPPTTERNPINLIAGGGAAKKLEPLKAVSFDGLLTGKIVFKGTPPAKRLVIGDNVECLKAKASEKNQGDIFDHDWIVGEGEGVKNVVVFLKTPDGMFFPVVDADKVASEDETAIDQPFCAFHPQVAIHYPAYYDADGKIAKTGQKPVIYNRGDILHNANLQDADPKYKNSGFNENIPPGTKKEFSVNAQPRPLSLSCSIHPWMKANIWVFNHSYAVRSDDKGAFTLKNLPTGVDLQLVFWHPTIGYFSDGDAAGRKIRFTPGKNPPLEVPISPK